MENQGVEQAAQPTLCSGGCGFYSVCCGRGPFLGLSGAEAEGATSPRVLKPNLRLLPAFLPLQNVGTNGLCSKCYRELQARDKAVAATAQSIAEKAMPQAPSPAPSMPAPAPTTSTPAPPVAEASPSAPAPAPPKSSTRCLTCNKKASPGDTQAPSRVLCSSSACPA